VAINPKKKLERTISAFLGQAQRDGAIFGTKPAEGFYVRIDEGILDRANDLPPRRERGPDGKLTNTILSATL